MVATDALLARKGCLAKRSEETHAKLNGFLPPDWSHGNPIDILGDASADRYGQACAAVLADPGVDATAPVDADASVPAAR